MSEERDEAGARLLLRELVSEVHQWADWAGSLGADALDALRAYPWPGNVLELERVITHSLIASSGAALRAEDLQLPGRRLLDATPEPPPVPEPQEAAGVEAPARSPEPSRLEETPAAPSSRYWRKSRTSLAWRPSGSA